MQEYAVFLTKKKADIGRVFGEMGRGYRRREREVARSWKRSRLRGKRRKCPTNEITSTLANVRRKGAEKSKITPDQYTGV